MTGSQEVPQKLQKQASYLRHSLSEYYHPVEVPELKPKQRNIMALQKKTLPKQKHSKSKPHGSEKEEAVGEKELLLILLLLMRVIVT